MEVKSNESKANARREWHRTQLSAAHDDDALLALPTVCALAGIGKSSIYEKMKENRFPRPVKIGKRVTRWRAGDVRAWLRATGDPSVSTGAAATSETVRVK